MHNFSEIFFLSSGFLKQETNTTGCVNPAAKIFLINLSMFFIGIKIVWMKIYTTGCVNIIIKIKFKQILEYYFK